MHKNNKKTRITLIHLMFAISFLLMAYLSETTVVTGDGSYHLLNVKFIATHDRLPKFEATYLPMFWYPPLFHLITAAVYKAFYLLSARAAEFAILMVSPIFGVASFIVSYDITKRLFGRKVSLFSTAFMAFLPIFIGTGLRPQVDMLALFLSLIAFRYALLGRPILSGLFIGVGLLTKYYVAFLIPTLILMLWTGKKEKWRNILEFSVSAASIGIWWFLRNWIVLGNPVYQYFPRIFGGTYLLPDASIHPAYRLLSTAPLKTFLFETLEITTITPEIRLGVAIMLLSFLALMFFAAFGLIKSIPLRREKNFRILHLLFLTQVMVAVFFYLTLGIVFVRYVLMLFFSAAMFFGIGITEAEKIVRSSKYPRLFLYLGLAAIFTAFSAAMLLKSIMINDTWALWKDDIAWVKGNTRGDAFFLIAGLDSLEWQIQRNALPLQNPAPFLAIGQGNTVNMTAYVRDRIKISEGDYLFVTRHPKSQGAKILDVDNSFCSYFGFLQGRELVYNNTRSQTTIYRFTNVRLNCTVR